ncbi:MAG: 3-ketoacyl-ACP reductase [Thermoguttaceae bacterium]|jgi:NAD(P)-dependent dehydrogenase (short-subunit alcohol dehydrogenase family)
MKRVALITGGGRGIGLGISRCLAREGLDLALCGMRDEAAVAAPLAELRRLGAEAIYVQADVGQAEARRRLVEAIRRHFGRLHVLVNNAGMAPRIRADILEASEESFVEVLRTNLQGPYFLTQACARWMIEQKRADAVFAGGIVNVSSISASVASVFRGEYCLSKAALSMATQLWAARLGEFDIPVYEVRPGVIRTDMTAGVAEKYDRLLAEGLAVQRRWGTPDDVGRAVAALVRGDFPYSTGQVILVDGGLTLPRL